MNLIRRKLFGRGFRRKLLTNRRKVFAFQQENCLLAETFCTALDNIGTRRKLFATRRKIFGRRKCIRHRQQKKVENIAGIISFILTPKWIFHPWVQNHRQEEFNAEGILVSHPVTQSISQLVCHSVRKKYTQIRRLSKNIFCNLVRYTPSISLSSIFFFCIQFLYQKI